MYEFREQPDAVEIPKCQSAGEVSLVADVLDGHSERYKKRRHIAESFAKPSGKQFSSRLG
jgi:hypothetical protein